MVKSRKQNRRRRIGVPRSSRTRLPAPFNRLASDSTTLSCRGVYDLKSVSSSVAKGHLTLATSGLQSLNSLVSTMSNMSTMYDLFIVNRMTVKLIPTIPSTVGALVAVGYNPLYHQEIIDPTDLADVLISKHHISTNQMEERTFSFSPMSYTNEWCLTDPDAIDRFTNGYLQWYSTYTGGIPDTVIGYLDISFDITFAGLIRETR